MRECHFHCSHQQARKYPLASIDGIEDKPVKSRLLFSNYDDLRNPYYAGGGARALHEVAKRLAERHEVTILTGKYPGCSNGLLEGVQYEHAGCSGLGPKLGQLCFHFALPIEARKRAHDLWLESLTPPFSTACLQLFTRKPVVLVTQNLIGKAMARKYKLPFHWFERSGLKTYRYGIALSEPLRKDLLKGNPTMQVTVIPNGVEPALIQQKV